MFHIFQKLLSNLALLLKSASEKELFSNFNSCEIDSYAHQVKRQKIQGNIARGRLTLPETNIAPENGWLEYYFPIGEAYFQGLR